MNGKKKQQDETMFEIGLGLLEFGTESLQSQLDPSGIGKQYRGTNQHKTNHSKNGYHKGSSNGYRVNHKRPNKRRRRGNRDVDMLTQKQLLKKKDGDSQHTIEINFKEEVGKIHKKNQQQGGGVGGVFKTVGQVGMTGSGAMASQIIGKKMKNIKTQVNEYLNPIESTESVVAEEAIEGEAVEAALDLGLVATGIELAPIAAIGAVGYGLYELGKRIN